MKKKPERHADGKFKSGEGGRQKGTKNKKTKQWEQIGDYLTNEGAEKFKNIMLNGEDEDFTKNYLAVLEYFKPKLSRSDVNNTGNQTFTVKYEDGDNPDKSDE